MKKFPGEHRKSPTGIHHVVDQQHRAAAYGRCIQVESVLQICDLLKAVLAGFLRAGIPRFPDAFDKRQPKLRREAPGKIRH